MMWWGGFILLALIYTGYVSFINYKWKVPVEFAPAVISCSISALMLVAGFLGWMVPMVYTIGIGGFLSLGIVLWQKKSWCIFETKREYFIYVLWLVILGIFALFLQGKLVIHIDNFSHWVRIVKFLLLYDRLPAFRDDIIIYNSYPLGSAIYIYFISRIIGTTEDCYIFAQMVLLISFLLPMVIFIHRQNILCGVIVFIYALFALTVNISIYDLLVDTLMPLCGVALFSIIFYGFSRKISVHLLIVMMVPLEIFLVQVKHSGIFFFLVCATYFMMNLKSLKTAKSNKIRIMKFFVWIGVGGPLVSLFWWFYHQYSAFGNSALQSPHAVSLGRYRNILNEKSLEDIKSILFQMMEVFTDFCNISVVIFLLIIFLFGTAFLGSFKEKNLKKKRQELRFYFLYGCSVFVVYIVAVFLMYLFSMPKAEAVSLAGFDRYMLSLDIFLLGMTIAVVISCQSYRKFSVIWALAIFCVFLLIYFSIITQDGLLATRRKWFNDRYNFYRFVQNNHIDFQHKYLLYMNRDDSGYIYLVGGYELWSNNMDVRNLPPISKLYFYDYLIIWTPDDESMAYLRDNGFGEFANYQPAVIPLKEKNGICYQGMCKRKAP